MRRPMSTSLEAAHDSLMELPILQCTEAESGAMSLDHLDPSRSRFELGQARLKLQPQRQACFVHSSYDHLVRGAV